MYSIVLEHRSGLEWISPALLRAVSTIRRIGHRGLEVVCVWPLLKSNWTRNVGYFMTAGGK